MTTTIDTQAHLLRSSKFADGRTRDWSIFVFFRILTEREMTRTAQLVKNLVDEKDAARADHHAAALLSEMRRPRRMNESRSEAFLIEQMAKMGQIIPSKDAPCAAFKAWLALMAKADTDTFAKSVEKTLAPLSKIKSKGSLPRRLPDTLAASLSDAPALIDGADSAKELKSALSAIAGFADAFAGTKGGAGAAALKLHKLFGKTPEDSGLAAMQGGLPLLLLYEFLRQLTVAAADDGISAETGAAHDELAEQGRNGGAVDAAPANIAFTHAGLDALKLDSATLASFPDAFREGMAARAGHLGDTGANAPEHWEGELGQKSVHGFFTGGFQVGSIERPAREEEWRRVREDITDFNAASGANGAALRALVNALGRLIGIEVVQIELGQDPYNVKDDGTVDRPAYRHEHFGFRDGISQPFVDLKLGAPPPGGGTPGKNRSWEPLAPGEIVLDQPDEDGRTANQPVHPDLRKGATFLVFRKLEQDVLGFRNFLKRIKGDDRGGQDKLAAEMMGRWPNGSALTLHPDAPGDAEDQQTFNDFTFGRDDPDGAKCPVSSHIRRSNPRDLGGNNDIRRHRIMRRGISYGGPFVPEGANRVEEKRGLLFICANSRIDLQFEVVQSKWINGGEFAGQAGLNKCPITGNNNGDVQDAFVQAGEGAAITRLPRFVTLKGGDYFFAPGIAALAKIADGETFAVPASELPYEGAAFGAAGTPTLFDPETLTAWAQTMIARKAPLVRVKLPEAPQHLGHEEPGNDNFFLENDTIKGNVVFVAQHADVKTVISGQKNDGAPLFSVAQYQQAGRRLLRGHDLLIGTQKGDDTAATRERLMDILDNAWKMLAAKGNVYERMAQVIDTEIEAALARAASTGEIDVVDDLASRAAYAVVSQVFGCPGPDHITEMAMALPFARQHVGQVYPDWLETIDRTLPTDRGRRTMQVWSIVFLLDLVGNVPQVTALKALGNQAANEMLAHFDTLIAKASQDVPADLATDPGDRPLTLLDCLILQAPAMMKKHKISRVQYLTDVRGLLPEIVGSPVATIPANFAALMDEVLDLNLDLPHLMKVVAGKPLFGKDDGIAGINRFIYEALRVNPTMRLIMRLAEDNATLPGGGKVEKGEWVVALLAAANLDVAAFPNSQEFSLHPFDQGAPRDYDSYLLFGAPGGGRVCWGRDRLGLYLMAACLKATARLEGMHRLAGTEGQMRTFLKLPTGLRTRFGALQPA